MSAIAGIYYPDGQPVDCTDLEQMVASLCHRGPDGAGTWNQGAAGLGHRMLRTTPESLHEKLPLASKTGDLVLTADARIDNRDELLATLGFSDRSSAQVADSQLILAAYQKWGERCPEKLLGDFAFAIWDGRRGALFCARDHFGVRPLYYYHRPGHVFVFASEIKALLCLPETPRRLNELRVAYYLLEMADDKTITFYQDIFRLPPGHSATVSNGRIEMRAYWSLDPSRELRLGSDQEYAEAFRELFTEAVRCRLRGTVPAGSTLSGGLDSSAVTCVAGSLLALNGNRPLRTFSAIFDRVPECDERAFIQAVQDREGFEPHFVHADRSSPLVDYDRLLWHQDEAFYTFNLYMIWGLCRAASRQGVRSLLDGIDGDVTVSHGVEYLAELARKWRWLTWSREAKALMGHFEYLKDSRGRFLWYHGLKYLFPEPIRRLKRVLRRPPPPRWSTFPALNQSFARRVALGEHIEALRENRYGQPETPRQTHCRHLQQGYILAQFEEIDRAAAAFSIELRHPFYDKRLVEFCLALPPDQKLHQGWTRMVLRRAMTGILPEKVRWRGGKAEILPAIAHGLLTYDRELLDEVILDDPGVIEAYVNVDALREVYHRFRSQGTLDDTFSVWIAATLTLWLRRTGLTP